MQTAVLWLVFLLTALLPFLLRDKGRRGGRTPDPPPDPWTTAQSVRTPDPYVLPLPNPHDARWRRWSKRSHSPNRRLPLPHPVDDPRWQPQPQPPTPRTRHHFPELPPHQRALPDDVVRLYVNQPAGEAQSPGEQ
ncbi:hypothetical protein OK074_5581 [Actinobacteria bacterium OK074]|nr:hypothetical protein OK074_5581 [Actinobacteria bacterium OK074]